MYRAWHVVSGHAVVEHVMDCACGQYSCMMPMFTVEYGSPNLRLPIGHSLLSQTFASL